MKCFTPVLVSLLCILFYSSFAPDEAEAASNTKETTVQVIDTHDSERLMEALLEETPMDGITLKFTDPRFNQMSTF